MNKAVKSRTYKIYKLYIHSHAYFIGFCDPNIQKKIAPKYIQFSKNYNLILSE